MADALDSKDTAKKLEAFGCQELILYTDEANEKSTIQMAGAAIDKPGKVDILVKNARIYPPTPFESLAKLR